MGRVKGGRGRRVHDYGKGLSSRKRDGVVGLKGGDGREEVDERTRLWKG